MITIERSPFLALGRIRRAVAVNMINGDRASCGGGKWIEYGRDIRHYNYSFREVLDVDLLSLMNKKSPQVIIDLMAPSDTLASAFRQLANRSNFGLALTLEDMRSDERKNEDESLNIKQLTGDIMLLSTWQRIKDELKGHKVDIIMERALRGLDCIPIDSIVYQLLLRRAWEILTDQHGTLLIQTPSEDELRNHEVDLRKWIINLRGEGIKVDWNKEIPSLYYIGGLSVLKLVKTPNSPEKLPFLK